MCLIKFLFKAKIYFSFVDKIVVEKCKNYLHIVVVFLVTMHNDNLYTVKDFHEKYVTAEVLRCTIVQVKLQ
jgi:hypothetical protein